MFTPLSRHFRIPRDPTGSPCMFYCGLNVRSAVQTKRPPPSPPQKLTISVRLPIFATLLSGQRHMIQGPIDYLLLLINKCDFE